MNNANSGKSLQAWKWMCRQESFSIGELTSVMGYRLSHAQRLVNTWLGNGHLRALDGRGVCQDPVRYAVVDGSQTPRIGRGRINGEHPRQSRKKTGQQRMWNTIKIAGRFTIRDLTMTAAVGERTAGIYVARLIKAGYLRVFKPVDRRLSNQKRQGLLAVYQLIRDTGRHAPMVRKDGCWDTNLQQLYPFNNQQQEARHEQDVA